MTDEELILTLANVGIDPDRAIVHKLLLALQTLDSGANEALTVSIEAALWRTRDAAE